MNVQPFNDRCLIYIKVKVLTFYLILTFKKNDKFYYIKQFDWHLWPLRTGIFCNADNTDRIAEFGISLLMQNHIFLCSNKTENTDYMKICCRISLFLPCLTLNQCRFCRKFSKWRQNLAELAITWQKHSKHRLLKKLVQN